MRVINSMLFWLASCTWGAIMTFAGALVAVALIATGHKSHRFHYLIYFEVGENWGGFELGPFFVMSCDEGLRTKQHEAGHGLQNIMLGPFMLIISVWSAIRYWIRRLKQKRGLDATLKPYNSIWFEGWATRLGQKHFK